MPDEVVYHCCPSGKKLLGLDVPPDRLRAQTPFALKVASAPPSAPGAGAWATPPVTCVPGATMSGLMRPSSHGPRLEKRYDVVSAVGAGISNSASVSACGAIAPVGY